MLCTTQCLCSAKIVTQRTAWPEALQHTVLTVLVIMQPHPSIKMTADLQASVTYKCDRQVGGQPVLSCGTQYPTQSASHLH
jgi:hypothetical protein